MRRFATTRHVDCAPDTPLRRVAVVRLRRPDEHPWATEAAFDAVEAWLVAAGHAVVYRVWQRRRAPAASTYLGRGKVVQLRALCRTAGVEAVVLDGTPTPAQRINLEQLLGCPVVDRWQWARPGAAAHAREGVRSVQRIARRARGARSVVLVGCAGAGKSALFSTLTRGPRLAPSWPPAQDPARPAVVTRRLRGSGNRPLVLVTDTPGLIWNPETGTWTLPAETDAERRAADLVLHVIDAAHPEAARQANRVERLLAATDAGRSASVIPVWTQADRVHDGGRGPTGWMVSGRTGAGCDELIAYLRQPGARP